jgi:hypothetical protein
MTALLDNKARFSDYSESLGLHMPAHHVVASQEHLRTLNNDKNVSSSRTGTFAAHSCIQHAMFCMVLDGTVSTVCTANAASVEILHGVHLHVLLHGMLYAVKT